VGYRETDEETTNKGLIEHLSQTKTTKNNRMNQKQHMPSSICLNKTRLALGSRVSN